MVGQYRIIISDTIVYSISNQDNIQLISDTIVEITHTCVDNEQIVFVKPKKLLYNVIGHVPFLVDKGTDEWSINLKYTIDYILPKPNIPVFKIK